MKPVRLRGPLGAFGLVAGLVVASAFLPDGCRIDTAASERLRIGVPLITPLVFVALASWLSRRRRARASISLTLLAGALWSAGIGLLYDGPKGLAVTHIAALTVWPFFAGALIAAPLALAWARRSAGSRAQTQRADRAAVWSFVAAAASVGAGVFFALSRQPLDLRLAWAGCAAAVGMVGVAGAMVIRIVRASAELTAQPPAPATAALVPLDAPLPDAAQVIDWGVGDARRDALDTGGAGPFRAGVSAVWLGDRDEALRRLGQDRAIAVVALVLALLGASLAGVAVRSAPPEKPPQHESVGSLFGGC
jgi:hypothetical protein